MTDPGPGHAFSHEPGQPRTGQPRTGQLRALSWALGVNVGLVYLVKYRISALLKKEIRRLEEQWNQA